MLFFLELISEGSGWRLRSVLLKLWFVDPIGVVSWSAHVDWSGLIVNAHPLREYGRVSYIRSRVSFNELGGLLRNRLSSKLN